MDRAKILIVDDDKNILITLRKALEMYEYDISVADSGKAACRLIESKEFDCILLDLRLPDIDGMEIIRRYTLKNVIMITAHGTLENAVEAMKLGCVDYLRKPFDLEVVREQVRQLLERRSLSYEQGIHYESLMQVAKLYVQDHHYSKAIEKVKEALEVKPDSSDAYNTLGVLYEVLGEMSMALKAYQTSISIDPNNDLAADNLKRIRGLDDSLGLKLRF